jgi:DNA-binding GntR family transcriptional regulator
MSIAAYIQNDLAARLESGEDLPVSLTLEALSQHYEVSCTPVRTAISALTEVGLIRKKGNGRLEPSTSGQKGAKTKGETIPTREKLQSDPMSAITGDLVRLSLKGDPIYLREEATASKYGLSRSAMRNILHRLAGEGLLEHVPRRGWRLRTFRQEDLQAFIEVREVLELKALELARPKLGTPEVEAVLQAMLDGNLEPSGEDGPVEIDNSIHRYLLGIAGNPYICDFFARHSQYYDLLFDWEGQDRATAIATVRQHRKILSALLAKDWLSARNSLSHHIRENHPILSQIEPLLS